MENFRYKLTSKDYPEGCDLSSFPRFHLATFEAWLVCIDDKWYVQEDYQDGEIWGEWEDWGSFLFDIYNVDDEGFIDFIGCTNFVNHNETWKILINKNTFNDTSSCFCWFVKDKSSKKVLDFYKDKIEEIKENYTQI